MQGSDGKVHLNAHKRATVRPATLQVIPSYHSWAFAYSVLTDKDCGTSGGRFDLGEPRHKGHLNSRLVAAGRSSGDHVHLTFRGLATLVPPRRRPESGSRAGKSRACRCRRQSLSGLRFWIVLVDAVCRTYGKRKIFVRVSRRRRQKTAINFCKLFCLQCHKKNRSCLRGQNRSPTCSATVVFSSRGFGVCPLPAVMWVVGARERWCFRCAGPAGLQIGESAMETPWSTSEKWQIKWQSRTPCRCLQAEGGDVQNYSRWCCRDCLV